MILGTRAETSPFVINEINVLGGAQFDQLPQSPLCEIDTDGLSNIWPISRSGAMPSALERYGVARTNGIRSSCGRSATLSR
jgi:hypothetical protein